VVDGISISIGDVVEDLLRLCMLSIQANVKQMTDVFAAFD